MDKKEMLEAIKDAPDDAIVLTVYEEDVEVQKLEEKLIEEIGEAIAVEGKVDVMEIKYWIKGAWNSFLEFIGVRINSHWMILKAIEKKYGWDIASDLMVDGLMMGHNLGRYNTKKTHARIHAHVREKSLKE